MSYILKAIIWFRKESPKTLNWNYNFIQKALFMERPWGRMECCKRGRRRQWPYKKVSKIMSSLYVFWSTKLCPNYEQFVWLVWSTKLCPNSDLSGVSDLLSTLPFPLPHVQTNYWKRIWAGCFRRLTLKPLWNFYKTDSKNSEEIQF